MDREFLTVFRQYTAIAGHTFSLTAVPANRFKEVQQLMQLYLAGARVLPITDAELRIFEGVL